MASSTPLENLGDDQVIIYWVDTSNRIVKVNQAWHELALLNQVDHLREKIVLGMPLWGFIRGREMQYLFEVMLDKVRQGLGPIVFPFRCDAPDRRRFMEQTIKKAGDGLVEVSSRLLKEELREPIALLAEENLGERSSQMIYCCGWCKKFELSAGQWVEAEHVMKELDLCAGASLPRISHGACPDCTHHITKLVE
jgi:hypothetical protein